VVVVDNGSSDGAQRMVGERLPAVELIELGANHGAAARTVGARRWRAPYVAFADDDSWWAPGALARAADLMDAHPRLALLAARVVVGDDERPDPVSALMARSPLPAAPDLPGPPVLGFLACGALGAAIPFSPSAASSGGWAWAARRSCWRWTSPAPAGGSVMWTPCWPTTIHRPRATPAAGGGHRPATQCGARALAARGTARQRLRGGAGDRRSARPSARPRRRAGGAARRRALRRRRQVPREGSGRSARWSAPPESVPGGPGALSSARSPPRRVCTASTRRPSERRCGRPGRGRGRPARRIFAAAAARG
jgi:hypothetical protein